MAITEFDPPTDTAAVDGGRVRSMSPAPKSGRPKGGYLPYFPALDGVRAVAVVAVLVFHGGFEWAVGGYLGVSTFFTLSGFLITSLLLAERGATRTIDLRAFWVRRFRRLMPASLAALGLAVGFAYAQGSALQQQSVGGDVVGSLAYVANWRFVLSGQGYNAIFSGGSPVQHFWSLAIEEQFYFVYPLLAWALLRRRRVTDAVFALVLAALTALSVALPLVLSYGADRLYYGTDSRAAELLVGGLLAVALNQRRLTERLANGRSLQVVVAAAGAAALVVCAYLWHTVANDSDTTGLLYRGGFFGYSLLSVAVVLASLVPIGPVRAVLATPVLRWIGQVSYGIYVYHWPVFLWVDSAVPDQGLVARFAIKVAATLALATLSARFLEQPVRKGRRLLRTRPVLLAPFGAAAVLVAGLVIAATAPTPVNDFESEQVAFQKQLEERFADQPLPPPTTVAPNAIPRMRVATFGDSTALRTGFGLNSYLIKNNKADFVPGTALLGCSIMRHNQRRILGAVGGNDPDCDNWDTTWKRDAQTYRPNTAMVQVGPWEVPDQRLPGDSVWRSVGDPVLDAVLEKSMLEITDMFAELDIVTIWITLPVIGPDLTGEFPGNGTDAIHDHGTGAEPARQKRFNEIIADVVQQRPKDAAVVDLAAYLAGTGEDQRLRPDGIHFSEQTAEEVSEAFLGKALIDRHEELWRKNHPVTTNTSAKQKDVPSVLWTGDSTALALALGMGPYVEKTNAFTSYSIAEVGCGVGRGGKRIHPTGSVQDVCDDWSVDKYPTGLAQAHPDLVVMSTTMWDTTDRQLAGDSTWRAPGDPTYDAYLEKEFAAAADLLHRDGAIVAWLAYPHINVGKGAFIGLRPYEGNVPERMDRMNELIREVAESRPWMVVIDLAKRAKTFPGGEFDETYRPDGVHFSDESASRLLEEWLGQQMIDALATGRAAVRAEEKAGGSNGAGSTTTTARSAKSR